MEKNDDSPATVGAVLDIAAVMSIWCFATLNLSESMLNDFFNMCSERLTKQGLDQTTIDKTIAQIKHSVNVISKELNGKDKH